MDDYDQARRFAGTLDPVGWVGWRLQVVGRTGRDEDAGVCREQIAAGRVSRVVLPLIPRRRGGGRADTITEWKRLAGTEPDGRLRSNYAGLIRFFARLTRAA